MKKTVLLAAALAVLCAAVPAAHAESVPAPLKQVQQGALLQQVSCADDRTLVATPGNEPACVYPESVEALKLRGFSEVVSARCVMGASHDSLTVAFGLEFGMSYEISDGMVTKIDCENYRIVVHLEGVGQGSEISLTVPYSIILPITPYNIQYIHVSEAMRVSNQTSGHQTFSATLDADTKKVSIGNAAPYLVARTGIEGATELYERQYSITCFNWPGRCNDFIAASPSAEHWDTCEGNLIPIPSNGTVICTQPIVVEAALADAYFGSHQEILDAIEVRSCQDGLTATFTADLERSSCVSPEEAERLITEVGGWVGDCSVSGNLCCFPHPGYGNSGETC